MHINIHPDTTQKWKQEIINLKISHNYFDDAIINESAQIASSFLSINDDHQKEVQTGQGVLEFSNIPIDDDINNPPSNAKRPYSKGFISELALMGVTKACGLTPFSYLEEKNGALVHEITPIEKDNNQSISSEGTIEFDFHTDGAYLPRSIRPHSLSLICLEDQKRTGTNLVRINDIIHQLSSESRSILFQPRFAHVAPETFHVKNKYITNSVLDLVDGHYEIKVALHSITALDTSALEALNELKQLTKEILTTKEWHSGDLLIFNNLRCLHGRGEIKGKRWLQRCYGTYTFDQSTIVQLNPKVV